MINSALFGDSVLRGVQYDGLLQRTPQQILNSLQSVFNFTSNYTKDGASIAALASNFPSRRESAGLPNGVSLDELLSSNPHIGAALICFGGNDICETDADRDIVINGLDYISNTFNTHGVLYCFIGVIDVNIESSMINNGESNTTENFKPYMHHAIRIASSAECIRQWCNIKKYPYIDIRRMDSQIDFSNITGDIVHPSQDYCEYIFSNVGKIIGR